MSDDVLWFFLVVMGIGFIFLILGGVAFALERAQCLAAFENYQPQYGVLSGCRVMWDGKLTPTKIIREIQ